MFGKDATHLKEQWTHKKGQYVDGSTDLGVPHRYYPVLRWSNNGTMNYIPKHPHWFKHAAEEAPTEAFFALQSQKLKQVFKSKGV